MGHLCSSLYQPVNLGGEWLQEPQQDWIPEFKPASTLQCVPHSQQSKKCPPLLFAGYYRYYNKYVNVKKGSVAGISMVLAAYVLFNYCRCYKELSECLSDCLPFGGVSLIRVVLVCGQVYKYIILLTIERLGGTC